MLAKLRHENKMIRLAFVSFVIISVLTTTSDIAKGTSTNDAETAIVVTRRLQDTYSLVQGGSQACNEETNFTYLVQENQCISNQYVLDGEYES